MACYCYLEVPLFSGGSSLDSHRGHFEDTSLELCQLSPMAVSTPPLQMLATLSPNQTTAKGIQEA